MDTEKITYEIQQMKSAKAVKAGAGEMAAPPSIADTSLTEDDSRSLAPDAASVTSAPAPSAVSESEIKVAPEAAPPKPAKSKRQLWDDLAISGSCPPDTLYDLLGCFHPANIGN